MKKKRSILAKFRNYFIAGVVVLIPIGITIYLVFFVIEVSSILLPKELNPNHYLVFDIPGVEIVITLLLITFIGWLSLSFLGKKLLELFNNILKKIPILRTIYSAIGQMTESFTQKKSTKNNVVLIEYPRKGSWAVGFATKKNTGEITDKTKRNLITNSAEFYNLSYEYLNDCLKAGLVYRREFYNDSEIEPENSLMFKITLIPFGDIGTPSVN